MKAAIIGLVAMLPAVAVAADPSPPPAPTTLVIPTETLQSLLGYLEQRPYGEVAGLVFTIQACASVQVPNNGVTIDRGQCPAVSAALKAAAEQGAEIARLRTQYASDHKTDSQQAPSAP